MCSKKIGDAQWVKNQMKNHRPPAPQQCYQNAWSLI